MPKNTHRRRNNANKVGLKNQAPLVESSSSRPITKTSLSIQHVQKELEGEFCPPLDPTLVAVILADCYNPSESYIESLRNNLRLLSLDAQDTSNIPPPAPGNLLSTDTLPGSSYSDACATSSAASCTSPSRSRMEGDQSSMTSEASFTSPFGFLTSLFPNTSPKLIETTLASAGWVKTLPEGDAELNIGAVVDTLLSEEFINEITERGYVTGEEGDPPVDGNPDRRPEESWDLIQKTRKAASSGNVDTNGLGPRKGKRIKPNNLKTVSVPLFDVRQRQHILPARPRSASELPPPDPWVHFASLATWLHHLVPSTPYARFLALFHNPTYVTPAAALRAHLEQISAESTTKVSQDDVDSLAELVPVTDDDEVHVRADVMRDAATCLGATSGRKEEAYDLLVLLRDLDMNEPVIAHSVPQPIWSKLNSGDANGQFSSWHTTNHPQMSSPASVSSPTPPAMFPLVPIAPILSASTPSPRPPANANLASDSSAAWQTVNRRANDAKSKPPEHQERSPNTAQPRNPGPPAKSNRNGKAHRSSLTKEMPQTEDATICRERADECRVKRDTALRQASSHWQRGKFGGEVAFFYAEEARKLDTERRQWSMRGARAQVLKSMREDGDGDCSIDLHGLTVNEGITVTKEILDRWWSLDDSDRTPRSFTIITGIGRHSSGSMGVLGPAVQQTLEMGGWRVRKEHGKLVVTGARRR